MVTIATFTNTSEAHLMRMRLESGGIHAFLQDENTIQMDWMLSNAIGGVRLQVADEDLEAARELIKSDEGAAETAPDPA